MFTLSTKPTFSIITPTFNRAYILPRLIKSVIDQNYTNWELIIIDDGSTDNTKELIDNYNDKRIKYSYLTNSGPSQARNCGLKISIGEWIVYIDSDNELFTHYLETMLDWSNKFPSAFYLLPQGHKTQELIENNIIVRTRDVSLEDYPPNLSLSDVYLRHIQFDGNGLMHRRSLYDEGIKWDEKVNRIEDWEFFMQLADKYPLQFLYVPITLFHYYQRFGKECDNLMSTTSYITWADAFEYIYQKHKNDKLMNGQMWYPEKVIKYRNLEKQFQEGIAFPPYLRYFPLE